MGKRYIVETENGIKVNLTNGINPFIGMEGSVVTRNRRSYRLLYRMPGTGKYTSSKSTKADTYVLAIIASMIAVGSVVLTFAAVRVDFEFGKLFLSFSDPLIVVYALLLLLTVTAAFVIVKRYRNIVFDRYRKYSESLDRECEVVRKAMDSAEGRKKEILSHYRECLLLENELTEPEAILSALDESFDVAKYTAERILYKAKIGEIEKKITENRYAASLQDTESMKKYRSLCECFEILYSGARFWDISKYEKDPFGDHSWVPAYFLTGIFDYIQTGSYPPMIITASGEIFVIYPDFAIFARSTTDFDVLPLDSVNMEFGLVPGHPKYGYIKIPESKLAFTTSDPQNLEIFVKSFEAYKNGTYNPESFHQTDSLIEQVALYCVMYRKVTRRKIMRHFDIGGGRTERIFACLSDLGIISAENQDGECELLIWDVEKIRELINRSNR